MSPPAKEAAAIVLDCRDHGESDKIVTFYCQGAGRLSGIAKGAKRSKRRFVNKLELFSSLHLTYSLPLRQDGLSFISAADLLSGFVNIRNNVDRYNAASLIREFILIGTGERERDDRIFEILRWALQSLDEKRPHLPVVILFLIRFFDYLGYRPDLDHCHRCGRSVVADKGFSFNYMTGGIACSDCTDRDYPTTIPLSLETIRLLANAQDFPQERLHRLQFSPRAMEEALDLLNQYGRHLFQRDIHSWQAVIRGLHMSAM